MNWKQIRDLLNREKIFIIICIGTGLCLASSLAAWNFYLEWRHAEKEIRKLSYNFLNGSVSSERSKFQCQEELELSQSITNLLLNDGLKLKLQNSNDQSILSSWVIKGDSVSYWILNKQVERKPSDIDYYITVFNQKDTLLSVINEELKIQQVLIPEKFSEIALIKSKNGVKSVVGWYKKSF